MKCLNDKINSLKEVFSSCTSKQEIYQKIITLGSQLPPLDPVLQVPENLVNGCQSTTYLAVYLQDDKVYLSGSSDALISAGLVSLLTSVYTGESPEDLIQDKAIFLQELGIFSSLSLNRSNGLSQMILHIKRKALQLLTR